MRSCTTSTSAAAIAMSEQATTPSPPVEATGTLLEVEGLSVSTGRHGLSTT